MIWNEKVDCDWTIFPYINKQSKIILSFKKIKAIALYYV